MKNPYIARSSATLKGTGAEMPRLDRDAEFVEVGASADLVVQYGDRDLLRG